MRSFDCVYRLLEPIQAKDTHTHKINICGYYRQMPPRAILPAVPLSPRL
jgi:hypothetical protein